MVGAVHFFATTEDEHALLDYLGKPTSCRIFPWRPIDHAYADSRSADTPVIVFEPRDVATDQTT